LPLWVKSRHQRMSAACPLYPQKRTWFRGCAIANRLLSLVKRVEKIAPLQRESYNKAESQWLCHLSVMSNRVKGRNAPTLERCPLLPQISDIDRYALDVRFVPKADIRRPSNDDVSPSAGDDSFDLRLLGLRHSKLVKCLLEIVEKGLPLRRRYH